MWGEFFNTAAVYEIKSFDELLNVVKSEDHTLRSRVLIEFSPLSSFILDSQPWLSLWSMRYHSCCQPFSHPTSPPWSVLQLTVYFIQLQLQPNTPIIHSSLSSPCYSQLSWRTPIAGPNLTLLVLWLVGVLPLLCLLLSQTLWEENLAE